MYTYPFVNQVLIIGGGDGGVAREVAKHPGVKSITQVEIDALVIAVSKKYLPSMSTGFSNPKVQLHVGDGFEFLKSHSREFDVVITDSSDPVGEQLFKRIESSSFPYFQRYLTIDLLGPAESLYQESYFKLLSAALRPGGIVCSQAGTAWANLDHVSKTLDHCRSAFAVSAYGIVAVPTYPTGQIGFVVGSLNPVSRPNLLSVSDFLEE